jgi:hypothetical protein
MRLTKSAGVAGGCLLALVAAHAAQAGWQDTPDSLQLESMGDEMKVNGTPMAVRGFVSPLPMETLLKQVQDAWGRGSDRGAVARSNAGSWTVLNQTIGSAHRSFQVRESAPSQTEGFVALTSPALAREPKLAVALPSDLKPVSVIDSHDQGRVSQQVIAVSPRSIDATANALETALKAGGWERHVRHKNGTALQFSANKGEQEFDAMLQSQKNGSLVMMNTVTKTK